MEDWGGGEGSLGWGKSGKVAGGVGGCGGQGGSKGVEGEWGGGGGGKESGSHRSGAGGELAGVVEGDGGKRCGGALARKTSPLVVGRVAESADGPIRGGDWSAGSGRNRARKKRGAGGCGEANSTVGHAWDGVGGVGSCYGDRGGGGSLGLGERKMRNKEELRDLVRQAVVETLRKKVPVLDGQRLGADLGAESIDRIDLTFRLEEAVGKALEDKILFAEPDPTVAELAERLGRMLGERE